MMCIVLTTAQKRAIGILRIKFSSQIKICIKLRMNKKTVIVTGFGPFGSHAVNASWECVKQLKKIGLGDDIDLFIYEIPVEYSTVKKQVPELWNNHKPDLVVHVGVSGVAKEITLEQKAHNKGYNRKDVQNCIADDECCVQGGDECITAGLNMEIVCNKVNVTNCKAKTVISHDAGRFV
ncbi:Pyroglutamyl-peptidase 1 [Mactra antiquata]